MIIFFGLLQISLSTMIAFVLSWMGGGLNAWIAIASLLLSLPLAQIGARVFQDDARKIMSWSEGSLGWIEKALTFFILWACVRHFTFLVYQAQGELRTLDPSNFGDISFHIGYIRAIARGLSVPYANPIFSGDWMRYAVGMDVYNALWECLGVPMASHLFLVGLFSSLASIAFLRRFGSAWALGGFFLSGGWAGWQIFSGAGNINYEPLLAWKNLFMTVFVTQRGMLYALPVGLLLLMQFNWDFNQLKFSKRKSVLLAWIWGTLPFFHLHAFFCVSLIIAAYLVAAPGDLKEKWHRTRFILLPAFILGASFVIYSTDFFRHAGVIHLSSGWMIKNQSPLEFINFNFGPYLLVFICLIAVAIFKPVSAWRQKELLIYTCVFTFFFFVILAPWDWDNIKILIWPYLGFLSLAHRNLDPLLDRLTTNVSPRSARSLGLGLRGWIAFLLFFSGFSQIYPSLVSIAPALNLVRLSEVDNTAGAIQGLSPQSVFAAATTHDHPLVYQGALRALGYEGHLWSHGIDAGPARAQLNQLMSGVGNSAQIARELHVTHVFWGPLERAQFPGEPAWRKTWKNVSVVAGYEVYDVPK